MLLLYLFYTGFRRKVHPSQGTREGVGRKSQAFHQRLHQELWRGDERWTFERDVREVRRHHFSQGNFLIPQLIVCWFSKFVSFAYWTEFACRISICNWLFSVKSSIANWVFRPKRNSYYFIVKGKCQLLTFGPFYNKLLDQGFARQNI